MLALLFFFFFPYSRSGFPRVGGLWVYENKGRKMEERVVEGKTRTSEITQGGGWCMRIVNWLLTVAGAGDEGERRRGAKVEDCGRAAAVCSFCQWFVGWRGVHDKVSPVLHESTYEGC